MSDLRNGQDAVAGSKACTHCSRQLPLEDFPAAPRKSSGRSSWCRGCHRAAAKRWRDENGEVLAAANAARRLPPYPAKPCAICGETFVPTRSDGIYCSPTCRHRAKRARQTSA